MSGAFFSGVKQWEFEWQGRTAKLPVFYYDNLSITAAYTASTARVRALLPHADMHPVELYPGKSLVFISALEYRHCDIDPYNEVAIAFMITFGKRPIPGVTAGWQMARRRFTNYIWQLPVTTEIARIGGVELYGFPKFLADIDFTRQGGTVRCDLAEDGRRILSLLGKTLPTAPAKQNRMVCYSVKDGIPLVANVCQNPLEYAQSRDPRAVRLELGDHPIAQTMRSLGLSQNPVVYQYCPRNEAILFAGRNLMDD